MLAHLKSFPAHPWYILNTPKTVMTTRAPAVLKTDISSRLMISPYIGGGKKVEEKIKKVLPLETPVQPFETPVQPLEVPGAPPFEKFETKFSPLGGF